MKGKNKLVPRLLGITKECVMRVDEKTKEVIQEWSLTNIKRWAASPKSFTLVGASPSSQPSVPCSLPLLAPRTGRKCWHSTGTYQRGSGYVPASSLGATLCCALVGFWRLPGWLLLSADNRRGADCPADCWLHRHHPEKGKFGERQLALLLGEVQSARCFLGSWFCWG